MAGYSLDFANSASVGPLFGAPVTSGQGTVVFGTGSPGVTAALSNISGNPWMLAIAGIAIVGGLYLYFRKR